MTYCKSCNNNIEQSDIHEHFTGNYCFACIKIIKSKKQQDVNLFIPLKFWFSKNNMITLPLIAINCNRLHSITFDFDTNNKKLKNFDSDDHIDNIQIKNVNQANLL